MRFRWVCAAVAATVATWTCAAGVDAASFGTIWPTASTTLSGVSPDGSIIVGQAITVTGMRAFTGTRTGTWTYLNDLPGGGEAGGAGGVANGGIVAGWGRSVASGANSEAAKWVGGVPQPLGDLPGGILNSSAYGISADGAIVVGAGRTNNTNGYGSKPAVFTPTGPIELVYGGLPVHDGAATDVSAAGDIVIGTVDPQQTGQNAGFRWTEAGGMTLLKNHNGNIFGSRAHGISSDGTTIVGESLSKAVYWKNTESPVDLGTFLNSSSNVALDASGDGSRIVGYGFPTSGQHAFIWDQANGIRSLKAVLTEMGLDVSNYHLTRAVAISDDGLTIVGDAHMISSNYSVGFIAVIPEPTSGALVILATFGVMSVRRRSRA